MIQTNLPVLVVIFATLLAINVAIRLVKRTAK